MLQGLNGVAIGSNNKIAGNNNRILYGNGAEIKAACNSVTVVAPQGNFVAWKGNNLSVLTPKNFVEVSYPPNLMPAFQDAMYICGLQFDQYSLPPTYADNAAALLGGLKVGQTYLNNGTLNVVI